MLSPGNYHLSVPKPLLANLLYRERLLSHCRESRRKRFLAVECCRQDIFFFINSFCFQFNPKHLGREVGPFITWDSQERAVRRTLDALFVEQDDILWEKSRYQGATWLALLVQDWCARFHGRKKFLCISHSEKAVDSKGDPDSLFWKLDFVQEHLPWWMPGSKHSKMKLSYPGTKSTITGAATSERSGVGGRASAILLDEFSKQREDRDILGQTADTGPRLFVGTHYGVGTAFYDLTQRPDLKKVVMHWSQHPDQSKGLYESYEDRIVVLDTSYEYPPDFEFVYGGNASKGGPFPLLRSPWYDRECGRRANTRDVAMHLDINPSGSQSQFFDALTIRNLVQSCVEPVWEGDLEYDPDKAEPLLLVPVKDGPLKLWVAPTGPCSVPPSKYGAGNDCASGKGRTPSVCSVADAATGFKVLEFVDAHMPPEKFAVAAVAICKLFKSEDGTGAMLNWEDKGPGLNFGNTVRALGYRRLWPRESASVIPRKFAGDLYGWVPTTSNKRVMLDSYRAALYDRAFRNLSRRALEECLNYRYSNTRDAVEHPRDIEGDDPSGAKSNHGDRVVADALAWLSIVKLGAGYSGKPSANVEPAAIGSLAWRIELAERGQRKAGDRRPIRRRR